MKFCFKCWSALILLAALSFVPTAVRSENETLPPGDRQQPSPEQKSPSSKWKLFQQNYRETMPLEQIIPKAWTSLKEVTKGDSSYNLDGMRIWKAELLESFQSSCGHKFSKDDEERLGPILIWVVEFTQKDMSFGGGVCLFFEGRTGALVARSFSE